MHPVQAQAQDQGLALAGHSTDRLGRESMLAQLQRALWVPTRLALHPTQDLSAQALAALGLVRLERWHRTRLWPRLPLQRLVPVARLRHGRLRSQCSPYCASQCL